MNEKMTHEKSKDLKRWHSQELLHWNSSKQLSNRSEEQLILSAPVGQI